MSTARSPPRSCAATRTSSARSRWTASSEVLATGRRSRPTSARSAARPRIGAFGGVARALPALPASREIQERASALGWDWDAIEGVWEKVGEELDELHGLADRTRRGAAPRARRRALRDRQPGALAEARPGGGAAGGQPSLDRRATRRVEALAAERGRRPVGALAGARRTLLWNEVKAAVTACATRRHRRPRRRSRRPAHPPPERCARRGRPRGRHLLPAPARRGRARSRDGPLRIVRLPVNRSLHRVRRPHGRVPRLRRPWPPGAWRASIGAAAIAWSRWRPCPTSCASPPCPEKLGGVPLLLDLHEDMPEFFRDRFAAPAPSAAAAAGDRAPRGRRPPSPTS